MTIVSDRPSDALCAAPSHVCEGVHLFVHETRHDLHVIFDALFKIARQVEDLSPDSTIPPHAQGSPPAKTMRRRKRTIRSVLSYGVATPRQSLRYSESTQGRLRRASSGHHGISDGGPSARGA